MSAIFLFHFGERIGFIHLTEKAGSDGLRLELSEFKFCLVIISHTNAAQDKRNEKDCFAEI